MLVLTKEFKDKVIKAVLDHRSLFDGSDLSYSKSLGIAPSVYNRMKMGIRDGMLSLPKWLMLGQQFGITLNERVWKTARTEVFSIIEEDILFCKRYAKARIMVDDCGIGKTYTAKYLSKSLKNCFYVDASQCRTKQQFVRTIAKTIGTEHEGRFADIKEYVKFFIRSLDEPIIIVDEAGDLEDPAFLILKELWNATEHACGWYMMGADGLREKIERGITSKKVGYREIFSRYSDKFTTVVPQERTEKQAFYIQMIMSVLTINGCNADQAKSIAKRCLINDNSSHLTGLRRAESLLILEQEEQKRAKGEVHESN